MFDYKTFLEDHGDGLSGASLDGEVGERLSFQIDSLAQLCSQAEGDIEGLADRLATLGGDIADYNSYRELVSSLSNAELSVPKSGNAEVDRTIELVLERDSRNLPLLINEMGANLEAQGRNISSTLQGLGQELRDLPESFSSLLVLEGQKELRLALGSTEEQCQVEWSPSKAPISTRVVASINACSDAERCFSDWSEPQTLSALSRSVVTLRELGSVIAEVGSQASDHLEKADLPEFSSKGFSPNILRGLAVGRIRSIESPTTVRSQRIATALSELDRELLGFASDYLDPPAATLPSSGSVEEQRRAKSTAQKLRKPGVFPSNTFMRTGPGSGGYRKERGPVSIIPQESVLVEVDRAAVERAANRSFLDLPSRASRAEVVESLDHLEKLFSYEGEDWQQFRKGFASSYDAFDAREAELYLGWGLEEHATRLAGTIDDAQLAMIESAFDDELLSREVRCAICRQNPRIVEVAETALNNYTSSLVKFLDPDGEFALVHALREFSPIHNPSDFDSPSSLQATSERARELLLDSWSIRNREFAETFTVVEGLLHALPGAPRYYIAAHILVYGMAPGFGSSAPAPARNTEALFARLGDERVATQIEPEKLPYLCEELKNAGLVTLSSRAAASSGSRYRLARDNSGITTEEPGLSEARDLVAKLHSKYLGVLPPSDQPESTVAGGTHSSGSPTTAPVEIEAEVVEPAAYEPVLIKKIMPIGPPEPSRDGISLSRVASLRELIGGAKVDLLTSQVSDAFGSLQSKIEEDFLDGTAAKILRGEKFCSQLPMKKHAWIRVINDYVNDKGLCEDRDNERLMNRIHRRFLEPGRARTDWDIPSRDGVTSQVMRLKSQKGINDALRGVRRALITAPRGDFCEPFEELQSALDSLEAYSRELAKTGVISKEELEDLICKPVALSKEFTSQLGQHRVDCSSIAQQAKEVIPAIAEAMRPGTAQVSLLSASASRLCDLSSALVSQDSTAVEVAKQSILKHVRDATADEALEQTFAMAKRLVEQGVLPSSLVDELGLVLTPQAVNPTVEGVSFSQMKGLLEATRIASLELLGSEEHPGLVGVTEKVLGELEEQLNSGESGRSAFRLNKVVEFLARLPRKASEYHSLLSNHLEGRGEFTGSPDEFLLGAIFRGFLDEQMGVLDVPNSWPIYKEEGGPVVGSAVIKDQDGITKHLKGAEKIILDPQLRDLFVPYLDVDSAQREVQSRVQKSYEDGVVSLETLKAITGSVEAFNKLTVPFDVKQPDWISTVDVAKSIFPKVLEGINSGYDRLNLNLRATSALCRFSMVTALDQSDSVEEVLAELREIGSDPRMGEETIVIAEKLVERELMPASYLEQLRGLLVQETEGVGHE